MKGINILLFLKECEMKTKRVMKLQLGILFLVLLPAVPAWAAQVPFISQQLYPSNTGPSPGGGPQVPFISQPLFPWAMEPGGPEFVLTVNGSGFVSGSKVSWNGSALPTTFVNSEELTATVPSANIAAPGTAWVTVSSGGVSSNVAYFEITNGTTSVSFGNSFHAVGIHPLSVAVGDFNGDGILDLAVANGTSNTVSVLLGNGEGTFQPAVNYPAGSGPISVAVGDFNDDGKPDLAVADSGGGVSVLLGNGNGTFQKAGNYPAGTNPMSVAVGDLNGDGYLDLAVANYGSNNVSVLLGKGDGTFQTAVNYAAGTNPTSVAVGDFNGDGIPDLAVADWGGGVSVLLGFGGGTFQTAVNYAAGSNPYSVAVGDFNGDGILDLAVANNGGKNVSVLLGYGDGTFQPAVNYAADWNPVSVAVGDFNGDGRMDLAVANWSSNNVSILLQPTPSPPMVGTITGVTAGTGLSGGGGMGNVTLTNTGILSITPGFGLITTGGQNPNLSLNTSVTDLRYLNPANFMPGTAGINITGSAGNALEFGGQLPSFYATTGANNFTGNQSVTGNITASGSVSIGGGTAITKHLSMTSSPSFSALKASTCATASFTFTGASDGDTIALGVPSTRMTGGGNLAYNAWVSAANTVTIQACNLSTATAQSTAGTGAIRVDLWKH